MANYVGDTYVYVIKNLTTGNLNKFGISSTKIAQRMSAQVSKLNKAGTDFYVGQVLRVLPTRQEALNLERSLVTWFSKYNKGVAPPGNKSPFPDMW